MSLILHGCFCASVFCCIRMYVNVFDELFLSMYGSSIFVSMYKNNNMHIEWQQEVKLGCTRVVGTLNVTMHSTCGVSKLSRLNSSYLLVWMKKYRPKTEVDG